MLGDGIVHCRRTAIALEESSPWFIAAMLGTITGTFGGVLADIVCNQIPTLFRPAPLCATCSFAGAWLFILCQHFGVSEVWASPRESLPFFSCGSPP